MKLNLIYKTLILTLFLKKLDISDNPNRKPKHQSIDKTYRTRQVENTNQRYYHGEDVGLLHPLVVSELPHSLRIKRNKKQKYYSNTRQLSKPEVAPTLERTTLACNATSFFLMATRLLVTVPCDRCFYLNFGSGYIRFKNGFVK